MNGFTTFLLSLAGDLPSTRVAELFDFDRNCLHERIGINRDEVVANDPERRQGKKSQMATKLPNGGALHRLILPETQRKSFGELDADELSRLLRKCSMSG